MSGRALTPPQTVGPFFHIMLREPMNALATPQTAGTRIRIEGFVYDGDRAVVPDAMVEIWQANAAGRYRHPADLRPAPLDPAFVGFGRCGTDERGFYSFDTIKPGPVPFDAQRVQAPHISMLVFARGLLDHLRTRAYFDDERANADDPVLHLVPQQRRPTLLAKHRPDVGRVVYRFDIVLQGDGETVFFDL